MTMTIAGRWPKKDGGIGGVRGDVGMEGSSLARLSWVGAEAGIRYGRSRLLSLA